MPPTPAPISVVSFLTDCSVEISRRVSLRPADAPTLRDGTDRFAEAIGGLTALTHDRSSVPVQACLGELEPSALSRAFGAASEEVAWIPSHRMTDQGTEAALAPLSDQFDFGDLIVGMVLLAPGCRYPEHNHPPHEVYLPISDDGAWRFGGAQDYVELEPDALVYNHPNDQHGIIAGERPLLALYVLWPS